MWIIYALLSAFFIATTDLIAKKTLRQSDEYLVGWFMLLFSTPFLAIQYFSHRIAPFSAPLAKTLLAVIPLEILATILYYRALKLTDISLSVPFLALTPVFVIFTGLLLLGERIGLVVVLGIVMVAIGAYSMNLREARYGLIHPIKAIFSNKGSVFMVLVALIFSVTSVMSKKAMLNSSPESIPFVYNLSVTISMAPIILFRLRNKRSALVKDRLVFLSYILLGLCSALSIIFHFKSMAIASVAYAISIKRLSLIMSVGYGWIFFRERDIHIRLASTFCMFLGVVMIIMSK